MVKHKAARICINLECIDCKSNLHKRSNGISRYTTIKNRKNNPSRMELKKFCPYCNMRTIHKEIK
uniref:Large ribosomal subunit protein bL33c n=1 Tax=Cyanidium caldarium TaxID=2771 RepID=RK33_CYACA|nr:ribosomal protein L33 [Cyanidium caldarium]Q9TM38.1 RecName: Full=Large ribosomal subunit protein bL33c; AltName: Full=50S ribosomal protein L33, chloroplastic [Cyanidium caldarium]AAF13017.1 unknown [Cyanidium caldarium]WDB00155.1 ribosomal protein L33 [Cyanidium caldarium]